MDAIIIEPIATIKPETAPIFRALLKILYQKHMVLSYVVIKN
jgi:hypothetical protein